MQHSQRIADSSPSESQPRRMPRPLARRCGALVGQGWGSSPAFRRCAALVPTPVASQNLPVCRQFPDGPNRTPFQPVATPGSLAGRALRWSRRASGSQRSPRLRRRRGGGFANRVQAPPARLGAGGGAPCPCGAERAGARSRRASCRRGSPRRASAVGVGQDVPELKRDRRLAAVRSGGSRSVRRKPREDRSGRYRSRSKAGVSRSHRDTCFASYEAYEVRPEEILDLGGGLARSPWSLMEVALWAATARFECGTPTSKTEWGADRADHGVRRSH